MNKEEFRIRVNELGKNKTPFFFIIDFEMKKPKLFRLDKLPENIFFDFNGTTNTPRIAETLEDRNVLESIAPIAFDEYKSKFDKVMSEILYGNTFLINLTDRTPIKIKLDLRNIYRYSKADYKLFYDDKFVVFSPETFIKIRNGKIFTYPMKGTIDADLENGMEILLKDDKELAEHYTIVDLLRNDLGMVASNVEVNEFRYFTLIESSDKRLWQTSSEISGDLPKNYEESLGDIIIKLLPAGSISGAPKKKTVEIIQHVEGQERGYYSGVMGLFDGDSLDTAVMIRFIEKEGDDHYYRSGCGITFKSKSEEEYQEMIDKIYVPIR